MEKFSRLLCFYTWRVESTLTPPLVFDKVLLTLESRQASFTLKRLFGCFFTVNHLMAQWVDMEAEKSRTERMLVRDHSWLILEADLRLPICRIAPRESKKHKRFLFSNAFMSTHWAIRRVSCSYEPFNLNLEGNTPIPVHRYGQFGVLWDTKLF